MEPKFKKFASFPGSVQRPLVYWKHFKGGQGLESEDLSALLARKSSGNQERRETRLTNPSPVSTTSPLFHLPGSVQTVAGEMAQ